MDEAIVTRPRKQRKYPLFPLLLVLYTCIVLVLLAFGIRAFSGYLRSYERSLPYNTTDAYMQMLTPEYICQKDPATLYQIDTTVQTPEEAAELIRQALSEPVTFFKRVKECTDTKLVYTLRVGAQNIGSFEMEPGAENDMGFAPWVITKETFDLSFLLQDGFTVTVAHDATVTVNGKVLSEQNITEAEIPYAFLSDFYGDYALPTKTTYQIGKHIGDLTAVVTDANGDPIDPNAEDAVVLDNCSADEKAALDASANAFITDYIHFTSQTNKDTSGNLARLRQHIVSGTKLDKRMRDAVTGLKWVTDRNVSIRSIAVNQYVSIGNGRYVCDITYLVDTRDITGKIESESNLSVVLVQTDAGLKAEAMISK